MFALRPRPHPRSLIPSCTPRIVARGARQTSRGKDDDAVDIVTSTVHRHAKTPLAEPWLAGEGKKYEKPAAGGGPNWLGGKVVCLAVAIACNELMTGIAIDYSHSP